jgi:hypothetical protein
VRAPIPIFKQPLQFKSHAVIASEAKQPSHRLLRHGLLRRFAPLRKRFAFVAGNDRRRNFTSRRADRARAVSWIVSLSDQSNCVDWMVLDQLRTRRVWHPISAAAQA